MAKSQEPAPQMNEPKANQTGFVEERGQFKTFPELRYQLFHNNVYVSLLPDRLVFITKEIRYEDNKKSMEAKARGDENLAKKYAAITVARRFDLLFIHSDPGVKISGEEALPVQMDYYLGHCPEGILKVPSFSKVRYSGLYPNIDLLLSFDGNKLKYAFEVKPGGNPGDIVLQWQGVEQLGLTGKKDLQFSAGSFDFVDQAPVSQCEGKEVSTDYVLDGSQLKFDVADYNTSATLIIDPALYWASSLQYNGYGSWGGVVTNSSGQYYVVDWEWNPGGADVAAYLSSAGTSNLYSSDVGNYDIIISKFSKTGVLMWACRYGGAGEDDVNGGVAMDDNNNLFIAGTSMKEFSAGSGDFPLQNWVGAYNQGWDGSLSTGRRGYLLKFLPDNSRQWATYLDRGANLEVFDIDIGMSNAIYMTGTSGGSPTYITAGTIPSGSGYAGALNGTGTSHSFIIEFNSSGAIAWATWLPGVAASTSTGRCSDITVNKSNGYVYVSGDDMWSFCTPFNASLISAGYTNRGESDLFYMCFNSSNQPVAAYGKYVGGAGFDKINIGAANGDIELDASGNLYACGHTYSANFPLVNPGSCTYYDGVINDGSGITANVAGTQDGYLYKVNTSGTVTYSTFFGGTGYTAMKQLKKDSHNNLWICGLQIPAGLAQTTHTDYFNQAITGTNTNILLAQLGNYDNMEWLAYYGFSGYSDYNGFDIMSPAADSVYLYLAGNFGVTSNTGGGYQYVSGSSCSGAAQFRHKLASAPFTISGTTSICTGVTTNWTATTGGGVWSSSNTGIFTVNAGTGAVTGAGAGTATLSYTLTIGSCVFSTSANITVTAGTLPSFNAMGPYCIGATPGALPGTSTNGIAGTWSPAAISTAAAGTTTYTFTPSVPCASSTTLSVTVNSPLTATITAGGPTTFCSSGSVVLTASGGSTYLWSTGATGSSITVSYTGTFTVSITSGCGSPASAPVSTTVYPPPVAIITGTNPICVGTTSVLSAASSIAGYGAITGYQWWYDNGVTNTAIGGATGVTYTASAPGTYSVVVTDSNGCSSVSCP